ncbi:glycosyl hydrolase 108 family protein [Alistipes sp. ZOR0009]|jgi:lysozyme family protein|uniref:glycosyl hydrolase 108 family protein n=1 Tax=Alistipes sp. ZOR0009 TaxID=1339253 RepID=UPI0006463B03|nr:glycosyl hydrolase 108 family protein [Alistipes sp. ZOR0009]
MISFSQFKKSVLPFVLKVEKGYANVKGDSGGETYRGITRKSYPDWEGWTIIDRLKLRQGQVLPQLEDSVAKHYWEYNFALPDFDSLNSIKVALSLFDWRIHGGLSAGKVQTMLSQSFNLKTNGSGAFDRETIELINQIPEKQLLDAILNMRKSRIAAILKKDPSKSKFKKGWIRRLDELKSVTA